MNSKERRRLASNSTMETRTWTTRPDRNAVALLGRDLLVPLDQPTASVDGDVLPVSDRRRESGQRPLTCFRSASADVLPVSVR